MHCSADVLQPGFAADRFFRSRRDGFRQGSFCDGRLSRSLRFAPSAFAMRLSFTSGVVFGSTLPLLALGGMLARFGFQLTPELLVGNTSRLLDLAARLIQYCAELG